MYKVLVKRTNIEYEMKKITFIFNKAYLISLTF